MKVIKRDGTEAIFDQNKIVTAIKKANNSVNENDKLDDLRILNIACTVEERCEALGRAPSVEEIQDMVEFAIMDTGHNQLAKNYITYRYQRAMSRSSNTTDERILTLVDQCNEDIKQENSNKNPTIISTQRDYIAGEASKDISDRLLLPQDIVEADREGIIHFHDKDYYLCHEHNCFSSSTRFVTDTGVKAFRDFRDGELVKVVDKDGNWRDATVHYYGRQNMYDVTLVDGRTEKVVTCTANHRWILKDGTVTTNLKVGDRLYKLTENQNYADMLTKRNAFLFALGFTLGDGCDKRGNFISVRLCKDKVDYQEIFKEAGFYIGNVKNSDDLYATLKGYSKQSFLDTKMWRYLSLEDNVWLFKGYFAADGTTDNNHCRISTTDPRLVEMIKDISSVAGYYICSIKEYTRDTNFKKDSLLYTINLRKSQQAKNRNWKVVKITPHYGTNGGNEAWCVEEPITHSFTLDGGIVTGNCDLVNLEDMLQNGTVISETMIEKPHSFSTACNIATQIIAQVASSQYGGQSISLSHLAPFVDVSRQKIREDVIKELIPVAAELELCFDEVVNDITEKRIREEIKRGVQTIQYQILTLLTTNGQTPFVTEFMYLNEVEDPQTKADLAIIIEETLIQRMQGVKNEKGVWITPAFPKLIYVLEEDNIHPDSKYYYLTEIAAKCTAKRMVPDYISEKKMKEYKEGNCFPVMGCRANLSPWKDENGNYKFYGRFNQGVVTINLVDVALSSGGDYEKFWKIFDERLDLCYKGLMCRHERLKGTVSDVAPILWRHGAIARLEKGETIDKLLYGGYSTISLGYAGLYECVKYMTGKSHSDPTATPFALEVMQYMNDKCNKWKKETNIGFAIYGSPIESTTYKFAKCLQKRFGVIEGITDKNYITNSYHIPVTEEINAFDKLAFEAQFQHLSTAGAISYIEVPNMQNNIPAVLSVLEFIYDNIMYAELNTKSDYCQVCGYDGEIQIVDEDGKLVWECPNCKNRDQEKMNVARRTCGYIGSQFWNQGRTQEIKDRVLHL